MVIYLAHNENSKSDEIQNKENSFMSVYDTQLIDDSADVKHESFYDDDVDSAFCGITNPSFTDLNTQENDGNQSLIG